MVNAQPAHIQTIGTQGQIHAPTAHRLTYTVRILKDAHARLLLLTNITANALLATILTTGMKQHICVLVVPKLINSIQN